MELNISLSPEILFHIGSFPVTNAFLLSVIVSTLIMIVSLYVRYNFKKVPGKLQNVFEMLLEAGYDFTKSIIGDNDKARRAFPLVFTMFIFIMISNLIVFIPGQSAISIASEEGTVPVFRAVMSDYGLVFVLTMITIVIVQIVAVLTHGPFGYMKKFINFKSPLKFFLGIMDIISELARILSLSFRLFGNIFAGEVLAAVMLFLLPFIAPLPFMFLGLLTAVVQAFVFSVLTLVFISLASEIEEDELVEQASV